MKTSWIVVSSRIRLTRAESQPNAGTTAEQQHRLAGRCVRLELGAAAEQDQRLAYDLEHVVAGQQHEHVDREELATVATPRTR